MRSESADAHEARREFAEILGNKGHAVDNARLAVALLEGAFGDGALQRTPELVQTLADLELAAGAVSERAIPKPGEGQILVRVHAAGVNAMDPFLGTGMYQSFHGAPPADHARR